MKRKNEPGKRKASDPSSHGAAAPSGKTLGLALISDLYAHKRATQQMTIPELSKASEVPETVIETLERQDPGAVTLQHLWNLARGLRHRLSLQLIPEQPPLPVGSAAVLEEFDRVMKEGKCRHFVQAQTDRDYPKIVWDIAGDRSSNRLYVIATNPTRKVRIGKACENTGGWSIEGQLFGIDVETNALAGELAEQIMKEHKAELLGRGHGAKR